MTEPRPHFTFLGRPLVVRPQGDGAFIESYPDPRTPRFEVAAAGGMTQLSVPSRFSGTTSLPWPAEGGEPIELAPVIAETLDRADPPVTDPELLALRDKAARNN